MPWFDQFDREAARLFPDLPVLKNVPMAEYTTFRVGGLPGGWPPPVPLGS